MIENFIYFDKKFLLNFPLELQFFDLIIFIENEQTTR
ncbi:hypothetical protein D5E71_12585 [Vibrio parahaemolyticus]|nr:hypothetical protein D5E71_12585 [Vibrio parahaemolyticus]